MSGRETYFYRHFGEVDLAWFQARWPNFHPREVACRHCGELLIDAPSLDLLQRQRADTSLPIVINSAYRCPAHNALVGGAPMSMHKFGRAFDQALRGRPREDVLSMIRDFGWEGIGLYRSFIHTDTGAKRQWGG
ncbi:MAG: D-Ala-D-Ala carboxypeptidase family metallohydrolase [Rhodospirillales bacterium]|nr:D-Ala-D-Ala carboxypeptidase family metallohydrolase [Rhodospirillales bacterium]